MAIVLPSFSRMEKKDARRLKLSFVCFETQADPVCACDGVFPTVKRMGGEPGMQLAKGLDVSAILGFLLGFFGFGCNEVWVGFQLHMIPFPIPFLFTFRPHRTGMQLAKGLGISAILSFLLGCSGFGCNDVWLGLLIPSLKKVLEVSGLAIMRYVRAFHSFAIFAENSA